MTVSALVRNPYAQLHLCVLLWGFTAILGKLITLAALPLVFWRVLIVSLCLLFWRPVWRGLVKISRHDLKLALLAGLLVTLHWLAFYGSIKMANASVAATCIALAPVFLSVLEPLLSRRPVNRSELSLAVIAVPGVAMVMGGIPEDMYAGFALGALAAFLVAIFGIINKSVTMRVAALPLTAIELGTGAIFLGVLVPFWPLLGSTLEIPSQQDIVWLLVLAFACTLFPFALSAVVLRKISVFSTQLAVNLEPVYAIILASIFLDEGRELRWPFYVGVTIILSAVVAHARSGRKPA